MKSGKRVQHTDGRRGIAYDIEQKLRYLRQQKWLVRFSGIGDERLHAVRREELTVTGLVDGRRPTADVRRES